MQEKYIYLIKSNMKTSWSQLSKTLPLLPFVALLSISCSTDRKEIPINGLKDVMTNLTPAAESFEISPSEETLLTGAKGTKLFIPADAFQFADGTTPATRVKIELKECYTLSDMIAENLSTSSGNRILETAGMIYIKASADGKELTVKEGKAFVVAFPKGSQTAEMDLFYDVNLGDTLSTWIPDYEMYQVKPIQNIQTDDSVTLESELCSLVSTIKYPIEMTDDLFDYHLGWTLFDGIFGDLPLTGRNGTILDYFNDPSSVADSIARKFYRNNWRVHFKLNIDKHGKMVNLRLDRDEDKPYFKITNNAEAIRLVKEYFENAPAFRLHDSIKVDHDYDYSLGVTGAKQLNKARYKKRFREQYSQYTNQAIQKMDKGVLDSYVFASTEMGWINCDRFWNIDDEEKTDFIVKVPNPKDTKVQLIFKDIKSLMSPENKDGKFFFEEVPLGEPVKVIALSFQNGKPTLATMETTIVENGIELSTFREFSLDELERELNK